MSLFRKRKKEDLADVELSAMNPQFEPGTRVLITGTPPGLDKHKVEWVAVEATVVWNDEYSGRLGTGVAVKVTKDDCPLQLNDGFEEIELIVNPDTLTVR